MYLFLNNIVIGFGWFFSVYSFRASLYFFNLKIYRLGLEVFLKGLSNFFASEKP
jgi:hypothetical protein